MTKQGYLANYWAKIESKDFNKKRFFKATLDKQKELKEQVMKSGHSNSTMGHLGPLKPQYYAVPPAETKQKINIMEFDENIPEQSVEQQPFVSVNQIELNLSPVKEENRATKKINESLVEYDQDLQSQAEPEPRQTKHVTTLNGQISLNMANLVEMQSINSRHQVSPAHSAVKKNKKKKDKKDKSKKEKTPKEKANFAVVDNQ